MLKIIRTSFGMLMIWSFLTGLIYPLVVTGIAQTLFPFESNGSLLFNEQGTPIGSRLLGQPFDLPGYFWGRPSATSPFPYNATASAASNLGPLNPKLEERVEARVRRLKDADSKNHDPIPVDLVTASASGLDPDISVAAARYQIPRIAKARHLKAEVLQELLEKVSVHQNPLLWRESSVNVFELNLALDRLKSHVE
jgi:potassium-transporting ATPase KdpC subunit